MKKYKLLKDLPWIEAWKEFIENNFQPTYSRHEIDNVLLVCQQFALDNPDFFEPIEEKKTYDNIEKGDEVWYINTNWGIEPANYRKSHCRSEIFLTREEAEDEHKRREWANRKDKFIPKEKENYFSYDNIYWNIAMDCNEWYPYDIFLINQWLAFRTREECQDAIDNHDIVRLFYTIR